VSERTNADIIRIVSKWQAAGFIHELTCRVDSRHEALVPVEREGRVVLACPTCGAVQEHIPAVVLGSEAVIDYNRAQAEEALAAHERRAARQDVWFGVAVILCMMTILPGIVGGAASAAVGGAIGAVTAFLYARRAFRKIDASTDPASPPS